MQERESRKLLLSLIIFLALLVNTLLLGYYIIYGIIERHFYLNLTAGTFLIIEMILMFGLIVHLFSKEEMIDIINENLFDGFILIILLALIGTIITSNILAIISCFIVVIFLIWVIFYFGDYAKDFQILNLYLLGIGISVILLFFSVILIYMEFGTLILTEITLMKISDSKNIIITLLLLFGFGIPCGLFPFSIFHLKNYYHDSSYTGLLLYYIFNSVNVFLIFRVLNAFSLNLIINGVIIMTIASIGLIISIVYIITELFTSLDGDTFSIKKIFGFSLCADFNMILLLLSFLVFLPSLDLTSTYLNGIIYFYMMIVVVKSLIFYTFFPIMLETYDDNLKLLGEFWEKYRNFGIFLLSSGLLITVPLSIISLNTFLEIFSSKEIINTSAYMTIAFTVIIVYIIYLIVSLILISITFVETFFSNKPRYVEREKINIIRINHYIPIIIIILMISIINIVFFLLDNVYYNLFESFLLRYH